jgi:hypothetical protein
MTYVGFEPTIPASERAKTVHAFDCAATVTGSRKTLRSGKYLSSQINFEQTQNYWVFGLCPSSDIPETREHNVSEPGSVSVLRWWGRRLLVISNKSSRGKWNIRVQFFCITVFKEIESKRYHEFVLEQEYSRINGGLLNTTDMTEEIKTLP